MSEDLHHISEPIPANEGWKQMLELLDKNLPVDKRPNFSRLVLAYYAAALFILLLVFTSISIHDLNTRTFKIGNSIPSSVNSNSQINTPVNRDLNDKIANAVLPSALQTFTANNTDDVNNVVTPLNNQSNITTGFSNEHKPAENHENTIVTDTTIQELAKVNEPAKSNPPADISAKKKSAAKGKWNIYAGVGMNATTAGDGQNLHPYPVAEAKYSINDRFYVSAGVAPFSPVTTNTSAKSKSVNINDSVNNLMMYNEKTTYNRFHYVDVPVAVGMNVTKNLSVQGGIQMSVLLNKKSKTSLEQYDFQMNPIDAPVITSLMAPIPDPPGAYDMKARTIDYRFIAGVRYNIKKFSAGLTYQHGLSPVLSGSNNDGKKNNVFALSLLYRIK